MPDVVLHIQTEDSPATRVLAVAGTTVRVGRGALCEVCLAEPRLAEVQCILRRRGDSWHLQPVGPAGLISIDDKPVDLTRPLPLGVTVRVGDHWLTLRHDDEGPGELPTQASHAVSLEAHAIVAEILPAAEARRVHASPGPREAVVSPAPSDVHEAQKQDKADHEPLSEPPRVVEPRQDPAPLAADGSQARIAHAAGGEREVAAEPDPVQPPRAEQGTDAERDRLAQWQLRLQQRERWLQARAEERKWEARWKAAGTSLRAKAAPVGSPAQTPAPPSSPSHVPPKPPAPPRPSEPSLPRYAEVARFRAAWNADAPPRRPEPPAPPRPAGTETPSASPKEDTPRTDSEGRDERNSPARQVESLPAADVAQPPARPVEARAQPQPPPGESTSAGAVGAQTQPDPLLSGRSTGAAETSASATRPAASPPFESPSEGPRPASAPASASPRPQSVSPGSPGSAEPEPRPRPKPAGRSRSALADRPVYEPVDRAPQGNLGLGRLQGAALKAAAALKRGLRTERQARGFEEREPATRLGQSAPEVIDRPRDASLDPTASSLTDAAAPRLAPSQFDPSLTPAPPMLGRSAPDTFDPDARGPMLGSSVAQADASGPARQIPGVTWHEVQVGDAATSDARRGGTPGTTLLPPAGDDTATILRPRPASGRFGPPPPPPSSAAHEHVPAPDAFRPAHEAAPEYLPPPIDDPEWPSARTIFAARGTRRAPAAAAGAASAARPAAAPRVRVRRVAVRPLPTAACAPESWDVPLWPVWVGAMLVLLVVGFVGLSLAWTWASDDASAGLVANRVLGKEPRPARKKPEPLDPALAPAATWWRSTPRHQFLWALALEKSAPGPDPDRAEEVRYYLHAARTSAPAQPAVRYALAQRSPSAPKSLELAESLGQSRDVLGLTLMGQRLLEAGKTEAALRTFGEALDMACRAELADLDPPLFLEDAQVHRYALPHEILIGPIVRILAEKRDLPFSEWAPILPSTAVASLAAGRALQDTGRSAEAEQAIDLVVAHNEEPLAGSSPAVHIAAQAEGLALRGRWVEAEALYRQAIDAMPDDRFRRSWWMNLADIYLRLNDDAKKRLAWEAAKGSDPKEEITRRVIDSQTQAGLGLGSSSSRRRGAAAPAGNTGSGTSAPDRLFEPSSSPRDGTTKRTQPLSADR